MIGAPEQGAEFDYDGPDEGIMRPEYYTPPAERWITCPVCNGDCVVFPDGGGCENCDGVGRLLVKP